jgi:peroxiredoxin
MTLLAIALAAMVAVQLPPSSARKSGEYSCRSTDGATINVTPSPGKALVLAFVNTECGSCLKVTLRLIEVYKSLPSREQAAFMVIAVNQDAAEKLPRFIQDVTLPFQACMDAKSNAERFLDIPSTGTLLTPLLVVIDRDGYIRDELNPRDKRLADPASIAQAIRAVLDHPPSSALSR